MESTPGSGVVNQQVNPAIIPTEVDDVIAEEVLRARIQKHLGARRTGWSAALAHPMSLALVGGVITASLGYFITARVDENAAKRSSEEARRSARSRIHAGNRFCESELERRGALRRENRLLVR